MDCKTAKEWISDYVDGVLTSDSASFEEHVRGCKDCSLELAAERQVEAAVASISAAELSVDFSARLLARYREERRSVARLKWSTLVGAAYGLSTIAIALSFGQFIRKAEEFSPDLTIVPNAASLAARTGDLLAALELFPVGVAACVLALTWVLYLSQTQVRLGLWTGPPR